MISGTPWYHHSKNMIDKRAWQRIKKHLDIAYLGNLYFEDELVVLVRALKMIEAVEKQ